MNQLKKTSKHFDLIYDVGLHQGQDTDFYLKKGFRVVAFEANPENISFCRQRFAQELESKKLIIIEGAIVDETVYSKGEKVRFYKNGDHSFWGTACEDWAYRNEVMGTSNEIVEVKAISFNECLEKHGIPYYLKADIVGLETQCLKALKKFENKPDYLSIRSEKVIFQKLIEEFRLLQELGYNKFKAIQQNFANLEIKLNGSNGNNIHKFADGSSGTFAEETTGKWKNYEMILREYKRIFILYWLFGDYSFLLQTDKGKKFISNLERVVRRPMPGWYDTHAKHSSINFLSANG